MLDDKGERLLSLGEPVQRRAGDDLPGAEHLRHQVSDAAPRRRQRGRPQPGQLRRAAREEPRPGRARHRRRPRTSAPTARPRNTYAAIYNGTLQRDWFLARARNFDTHARRRARRQRDPARRRRDADRRDARRLGAVPALRAPAPEAARPAELSPLRRVPADLPERQVVSVRAGARPRAGLGGAARRRVRDQVQALRLRRPDRRLRERRQAQRRLQRRRLRRRPVHADELQRHARRRVHARPRGRPLDAHRAVVRDPAVRHLRLHDLRRRGGLDHQRALPARPAARSRRAIRRSASCCCSTPSTRSSAPSTRR